MSERKRKPPSFPLPDPNQTGDLMNRLQTFLPQLQAANQGTLRLHFAFLFVWIVF